MQSDVACGMGARGERSSLRLRVLRIELIIQYVVADRRLLTARLNVKVDNKYEHAYLMIRA